MKTKTKAKIRSTQKPVCCPHGIPPHTAPRAFAGAMSMCTCCGNMYGHFGGVAFLLRLCPTCVHPDPQEKAKLLQRLDDLKVAVEADRISFLAVILANAPFATADDGEAMFKDISVGIYRLVATDVELSPILRALAVKCRAETAGYTSGSDVHIRVSEI